MKSLIATLLFFVATLAAYETETIYGNLEFDEPVLIELINCSAVQRLKEIDQHGIVHYFGLTPSFTRYEHSVGVLHLLRKFGAPLEEQIAGLLHDASHTVFSHVGDHVFHHPDGLESYQDKIHHWYLNKIGLGKLLEKHKLSVDRVLHKLPCFKMLEQNLPDVCIDRLEYNLHTGILFNRLTKHESDEILKDISFENGKWVFTSQELAKKLAMTSLYLTEKFWGSDWESVIYHWAAEAIRRAFDIKLLTFDEIHLSTDGPVFDKLINAKDPKIEKFMTMSKNHKLHYTKGSSSDFDFFYTPKFRGIDPLIKKGKTLKRLTELDPAYEQEFERVRIITQNGYFIKFKTPGQ